MLQVVTAKAQKKKLKKKQPTPVTAPHTSDKSEGGRTLGVRFLRNGFSFGFIALTKTPY